MIVQLGCIMRLPGLFARPMINKAGSPVGPSGPSGELAAARVRGGAGGRRAQSSHRKERTAFTELNEAYVKKHGCPFIIVVRDHDRKSEFEGACRQVERIARVRLEDTLP
jgi:hypothetical protein